MENHQNLNSAKKLRFFGVKDLQNIPQLDVLEPEVREAVEVVGQVLPFRVNNYVNEELIDWSNAPNDPLFQLTYLQKEMLEREDYSEMRDLLKAGATPGEIAIKAKEIRHKLNPHPAGQLTHNVPLLEGERVPGIQHKYRETCLVFPRAGQTCFAYCTFCFRWPQFIGDNDLKFATDQSKIYQNYIGSHPEITDVLITGGDPMIMNAKVLAQYIEPFLEKEFDHIRSIRIGTKVLSYWPYRFTTDKDADAYLKLFEKVVASGKQLAFMAHFNHPRELSTQAVRESVSKIRSTGAQIRCQSPLLNHVNASPEVWSEMWTTQTQLGMIPYYMFVERDTGPKAYFEIPLAQAYEIFQEAYQNVSGLARTVRGPSMSALPGKVQVDGIVDLDGERVFCLSFLQARNSDWVKRPFFAKYNSQATWLDDLRPAFDEDAFFFEKIKSAKDLSRPGLRTQKTLEKTIKASSL